MKGRVKHELFPPASEDDKYDSVAYGKICDKAKDPGLNSKCKKISLVHKLQNAEVNFYPKETDYKLHPRALEIDFIFDLKKSILLYENDPTKVYSSLKIIANMYLSLDVIHKTGIARTIADLRKSSNRQVARLAKIIRKNWKERLRIAYLKNNCLAEENTSECHCKAMSKLQEIMTYYKLENNLMTKQLEILSKLKCNAITGEILLQDDIVNVIYELQRSRFPNVAEAARELKKHWKSRFYKLSEFS